jgi:CoA:oxalate CoA-transferase
VARLERPGDARAGAPASDGTEREALELICRGKHSVGVDVAGVAAVPVLDAMLRVAQVLVVDRDGLATLQSTLALDDLRERYPRLTVCAATPFGLEGPLAAWTGGEEIVQAISGIMSITGHAATGPARIAGAPLTHAAAMFAVSSILADVLRKRQGERAGSLDVAVYDAALAFLSASLPAYWLSGIAPGPIGNRHSMAAPWNSFRCADGWVIICAGNHPTWVRLCETIGRPDLLADPRYGSQGDRVAHVEALEAEVTAWTCSRSVAEVEAVLNGNSIAAGSVLPLHDVVRHPQFAVRGLLAQEPRQRQSGGVFHLDREPLDVREAPWRRGAGTRRVLLDCCHVRRADYERWLASKAIFQAEAEEDVQAA